MLIQEHINLIRLRNDQPERSNAFELQQFQFNESKMNSENIRTA